MPGYTITSGTSAVALSAATAKTVLGVVAASNVAARLTEFGVSFDGAPATAVPVLVELCDSTGATAGTPGATPTPKQVRGITRAAQATAGNAYSAEPTTLTAIKQWLVHAQTGMVLQSPLGREVEHVGAGGLFLRITAPATVNVRAYMEFEEG